VTDKLTPERRSANMASIRSRDTAPEMAVRKLAHALGYRFRLHRKDLPGKPDLVFPGRKAIIFVHGCFWHQHPDPQCKDGRRPKSRPGYWGPKLDGNLTRDARRQAELEAAGWKVLVVWECRTRDTDALAAALIDFLGDR
jgi:DNA mismatch endonuclease (patch repair protein)